MTMKNQDISMMFLEHCGINTGNYIADDLYYSLKAEEFLAHHGVKGMKWGFRRFQNEDGSLTEAGKARQSRAVARYTRLKDKADKYSNVTLKRKRVKYEMKAAKAMRKATKRRLLFGSQEKQLRKAAKYQMKVAKLDKKKLKAERRAERYANRQLKKLYGRKLSRKDRKQMRAGEEFMKRALNNK